MANKVEKSMMLVKSSFGPMKSFKLMPISNDCPFVECLFSPSEKIMVILSKVKKQSYHMVAKLYNHVYSNIFGGLKLYPEKFEILVFFYFF